MKKNVSLICLLFLSIISSSCKKTHTSNDAREQLSLVEKKASKIKSYKEYFITEVANSSKEEGIKRNSTSQGNNKKISALKDIAIWDKPTFINVNNQNYALIRINQPLKPFKNQQYEFIRYLAFSDMESNKPNALVIEILGKANTSLGSNTPSLIQKILLNELSIKNEIIEIPESFIIIYDSQYRWSRSYQVTKGKIEKQRIEFDCEKDIVLPTQSIKTN